ncbi:MAG: flagellar filament capping protein FliD [Clostridiales bacterium]|jgi:flagellar hook-associated protein 2|nr:flagellar filament capping protein FliD [Clostridiales bacterium]
MATYSNTMRLTGLSGLDTETFVQQLMKAESMKYTTLKKRTTLLEWKQEAYRASAKQLSDFQTKFLSLTSKDSIRLASTFSSFANKVTSSLGGDSSKISVAATGDSSGSSHTYEVSQLASKSKLESAAGTTGNIIGGSITDDDLKFLKQGDTLKFSLDGNTKTVTIGADWLNGDVANFAAKLQDALEGAYRKTGFFNVNVTNGKLNIGVGETGHEFKVYDGAGDPAAVSANASYMQLNLSGGIGLGPLPNGTFSFDVTDIGAGATTSVNITLDGTENTPAKLVTKINDALRAAGVNGLQAEFTGDNLTGKMTFRATGTTAYKLSGDGTAADFLRAEYFTERGVGTAPAGGWPTELYVRKDSVTGVLGLKDGQGIADSFINQKLEDLGVTGIDAASANAQGNVTIKINGQNVEVNVHKTVKEFMEQINSGGLGAKISFDSLTYRFRFEADSEGNSSGFGNAAGDFDDKFKEVFGFDAASGGVYTAGQDAIFKIDGVNTTRDSNTFVIDGAKVTLKDTTAAGEKITVEVKKDIAKTVDTIKSFVDAYNELIDAIGKQASTPRPKSDSYNYYEPLSDEEKDAMKEAQIDSWEVKAKTGMLYRDSIMEGLTRDLRQAMNVKVDVGDGKYLSLYDIGVATGADYTQGGKLYIDEDKLNAAIEKYGDKVVNIFTKSAPAGTKGFTSTSMGIADRVNNIVNGAIGIDGTIRAKAGIEGTYSEKDNLLKKQIDDQNKRLADMIVYLRDKEEYYYNMFAKMETAMQQANSQMSYITAQLGG